jgi:hypothetical protein
MLLRGGAGEPEIPWRKILGARWICFFGGKVVFPFCREVSRGADFDMVQGGC